MLKSTKQGLLQATPVKLFVTAFALLALSLPAAFPASASATAAQGGGCGSYRHYPSSVGLKIRACIYQDKNKNIQTYSYMKYDKNSKKVYKAAVDIQIERYSKMSSSAVVETRSKDRRDDKNGDVTYYVNLRPRPGYDKQVGSWVSSKGGQIFRSKVRLCIQKTSTAKMKCDKKWAYSEYQIAGDE